MIPFPGLMNSFLEIKSKSLLAALTLKVARISRLAPKFETNSDAELFQAFERLQKRAEVGDPVEQLEAPLFAIIREASRRCVGLYPFDEQLLAALVMRRGKVIQMDTGEGKTLVAPFVAIAEALYGNRCLVVTANSYLSQRDAAWMGPLYEFFNISCASILPDKQPQYAYAAYDCQVAYVSNEVLLFDYLRKLNAISPGHDLPITRNLVIVDEIDNVLIDQGGKTYSYVSPIEFESKAFTQAKRLVASFEPEVHFNSNPKTKVFDFTEQGRALLADLVQRLSGDPVQARFYVRCALRAAYLYRRDVDYILENGRVVLVDEVSGLPTPASKLPFGIQQAIEEKEGVALSAPATIINQTSVQAYYAGFTRKCGMSGSAVHNALEFKMLYNLDVVPIRPHVPCIRKDSADLVFRTSTEQVRAMVNDITEKAQRDRPVLVGTLSVHDAEVLAGALQKAGIKHQLLSARNYHEEAAIITQAGQEGEVTIAARLAGRGVDIRLSERARQAGGLHVIGFSRAADRRLDEQLQGRAGRQGDPGSSLFYLSLDDELLRLFAGKWVSQMLERLGMDEDEPIESELITKRISKVQRILTLDSCLSRHEFTLLEECIREPRDALFYKREGLAPAYWFEIDIDELFEQYVHRLLRSKSYLRDPVSALESKLIGLGLKLPTELYGLTDSPQAGQRIQELLVAEYARRRAEAGDFAAPRERTIFLRSIDLSWSRFVHSLSRTTNDFAIGSKERQSRLTRIADLFPFFSTARDRLVEETDDLIVSNLFRIDRPALLLPQFEWYGELGEGWDGNTLNRTWPAEDGVPDFVLHPESIQPDASLREYLKAFREDLQTLDSAAKTQERIQSALRAYDQFLAKVEFPVEKAAESTAAFLHSSILSKARIFERRFVRKVLDDFLVHLQRQGLLSKGKPEAVQHSVLHQTRLLAGQLAKPVVAAKIIYLVVFTIVYSNLNSIPLPFRHSGLWSGGMNLDRWMPTPVQQFVDTALLGHSWTTLSLGIVGLLPMLVTDFGFRLFNRNWVRTNFVVSLPAALMFCLLVTVRLVSWHGASLGMISIRAGVVFVALAAATTIILVLVDTANIIEVLDGVSLVLFVNLTAWLLRVGTWVVRLPAIRWWWAALLVLVLGVSWLARRLSTVGFQILRAGQLGFRQADADAQSSELRVDTIFDDRHLLLAFLVGSYGTWIGARILPPAWLHGIRPEWFAAAIYCLAMLAALWVAVQRRLSPIRIRELLDSKDSVLVGGDQAMDALQHSLHATTLKNATLQIILLASLMAITEFLRYRAGGSLFDNPFYFATMLCIWGYLASVAGSQLRFLISGYSSSLVMSLPVTETEDEDKLPWHKRQWKHLLKQNNGLIGVLVFVGGLLGFVDYLLRILRWIAGWLPHWR